MARSENSGVRTEHDLRQLLRECEARRIQLERIVQEAHRYVHGTRDNDALKLLKVSLSAGGYLPPKKAQPADDEFE